MKGILFLLCAAVTFDVLLAIAVSISDTGNLNYMESTVEFTINVRRDDGTVHESIKINNATAVNTTMEVQESTKSYFYGFSINEIKSLSVKSMDLIVQVQKSANEQRRYVNEFELSVVFDNTRLPQLKSNLSNTLTFIVRPPRFPHFQVRTDWEFWCPVTVSLELCNVVNGTSRCSRAKPYDLVDVSMSLTNVRFSGGNAKNHNFVGKIEECPLAYKTSKDIGIACITVFWAIALAGVLWGVIKYLLKRHRKRND